MYIYIYIYINDSLTNNSVYLRRCSTFKVDLNHKCIIIIAVRHIITIIIIAIISLLSLPLLSLLS